LVLDYGFSLNQNQNQSLDSIVDPLSMLTLPDLIKDIHLLTTTVSAPVSVSDENNKNTKGREINKEEEEKKKIFFLSSFNLNILYNTYFNKHLLFYRFFFSFNRFFK